MARPLAASRESFFLYLNSFYPQAQMRDGEVKHTAWDTASGFSSRSKTLCTVYKNCIREPVRVTSLQRDWLLLYLSVTVCKYSDQCV